MGTCGSGRNLLLYVVNFDLYMTLISVPSNRCFWCSHSKYSHILYILISNLTHITSHKLTVSPTSWLYHAEFTILLHKAQNNHFRVTITDEKKIKFYVNQFRGFEVLTSRNLSFSIAGRSYDSVRTTALHCDRFGPVVSHRACNSASQTCHQYFASLVMPRNPT